VRLVVKLGPELLVRYANLMGIERHLQPVYSLALGSADVTLLEMTNAFNTLANNGIRTRPLMVLRVEDEHGLILEQNRTELQPVLSPATAYVVTNMLQSVVNEGTATAIRARGYSGPAAGKTGTTDDYTDAWFIGYTPSICCGVWVGFDEKRTIFRGATGGGIAAPAWAEFMKQVRPDTLSAFPLPPEFQDSLVTLPICEQTGRLATARCPRVRYEVFIKGTEPQQECPLHGR
ncbi:MAG: penicillin-binding transpeptidase domain-containing protein, partial [candidate division WOR-3 bacterium]